MQIKNKSRILREIQLNQTAIQHIIDVSDREINKLKKMRDKEIKRLIKENKQLERELKNLSHTPFYY